MGVIQDEYGTDVLRVIAINIGESQGTVAPFASGNSALFLLDPSTATSSQYNINGTIPINYFVKPNGKIFHGFVGYNENQAKTYIDSCIAGVEENATPISKIAELVLSPNPFKTVMTISARGIQTNGNLTIQDLSGRVVKSFSLNPESKVTWNRRDNSGNEVPTGMYFCRFDNGKVTLIEKVVILK